MLLAIDGNNSVKRDITSGQADTRTFDTSDFYIPRSVVNLFQDEVNRTQKERKHPDGLKSCTDNWKADAPDAEKKTWDAFDETGFFISTCRHQIVITICDMVRSGELYVGLVWGYLETQRLTGLLPRSKYWIATVNKLLELFGDRLGIGYDIGCAAEGTARRSPALSEKWVTSSSRFGVPAFHGWAHGRLCQLRNHVRASEGFGLDDLETCERIFSASNSIASALRHASKFTRHRFIIGHFENWNQEMRDRLGNIGSLSCQDLCLTDDRYHSAAHCLLTKYKAAVATLQSEQKIIDEYKAAHRLDDTTIEGWIQEESKYLEGLKAEPEYDADAIRYVELLDQLRDAR